MTFAIEGMTSQLLDYPEAGYSRHYGWKLDPPQGEVGGRPRVVPVVPVGGCRNQFAHNRWPPAISNCIARNEPYTSESLSCLRYGSSTFISTISMWPISSVPSGLAPLGRLTPNAMGSVAVAPVKWLKSHAVVTLESPAFRKDIRSRDTISGSRLTATEGEAGFSVYKIRTHWTRLTCCSL